jgi:hypothetical protein
VVISRREVVAQEVVDAVARNLDSHDRGRFPGNNAILDIKKRKSNQTYFLPTKQHKKVRDGCSLF